MRLLKFTILPAPAMLRRDVECIRISEHAGEDGAAVKVAPNALPGIAFQHRDGQPALENIVTPSEITSTPTLFLYGAGTEPSVMNFKSGWYTTIQVLLRPQALKSLFGINAAALSNGHAELDEFSSEDLNVPLMEAGTVQDQVTYLRGRFVSRPVGVFLPVKMAGFYNYSTLRLEEMRGQVIRNQ